MTDIDASNLYEQDYYLWLEDTYQKLEKNSLISFIYYTYLLEIEEIYLKARKQVIKKTELPATTFPESCPFTAEQLLDSDFLP